MRGPLNRGRLKIPMEVVQGGATICPCASTSALFATPVLFGQAPG